MSASAVCCEKAIYTGHYDCPLHGPSAYGLTPTECIRLKDWIDNSNRKSAETFFTTPGALRDAACAFEASKFGQRDIWFREHTISKDAHEQVVEHYKKEARAQAELYNQYRVMAKEEFDRYEAEIAELKKHLGKERADIIAYYEDGINKSAEKIAEMKKQLEDSETGRKNAMDNLIECAKENSALKERLK